MKGYPRKTARLSEEGFVPGPQGVPVHYSEFGKGEPAIVCCNGFAVSTFFWRYLVEHFSETRRVITWDYRGHGESGSPSRVDPHDFSIPAFAEDLRRVLDACRVKRAVLVGHSMGCQVILEFWHRYRLRVAGLVPVCGAYGHPFDTFLQIPRLVGLPLFYYLHFLGTRAPLLLAGLKWTLKRPSLLYGVGRLGTILPATARYSDMRQYFEHVAAMDVRTFWTLAGEMQKHSAAGYLDEIDVPTLVVAGESDLFSPLHLSLEMRDRIDGAELLVLPKASHAGLVEQPELVNLRLEKFLAEHILRRRRQGVPRSRRGTERELDSTSKARAAEPALALSRPDPRPVRRRRLRCRQAVRPSVRRPARGTAPRPAPPRSAR
ncbi:MAG: alpha/beta hydrolase [Candidatus Riflebacteria bacterium]|nr:alpha/beta hydrolase [Candidatus Riflebacteria bacterium]